MQAYEIPNKLQWEEIAKFAKLKYFSPQAFKATHFHLEGIQEQILCQILRPIFIKKIDVGEYFFQGARPGS